MIYTSCKICGDNLELFAEQFELVRCKKCNLIFFQQELSETYLKDLYGRLYNQEDYAHFLHQATQIKKGIQPHLGYNKTKVLKTLIHKGCKSFVEIGAGVGVAGFYLQKKKLNYNGFELDAQAAHHAQEGGVNITNDSFQKLVAKSNVDAVICFEVLEHVEDLKHCFELIYLCLKHGGFIGFSVPNFNNFYNLTPEQQKESLGQAGPPVHINFFTVENLHNILQEFNFKPVYLRARPFPTLSLSKKRTYKKLWQSLRGQYHGSTILCVAQRENKN